MSRHKRTVGDLTFESLGPSTWDGSPARRTASVHVHVIFLDEITIPPNKSVPAVVTAGIFEITDLPREIASIYMA